MITKTEARRGRQIVLGTIVFLIAAAAILWSYNTLAAGLFGLAEMEFRHAVAAEFLLIAAGAVFGLRQTARRLTD